MRWGDGGVMGWGLGGGCSDVEQGGGGASERGICSPVWAHFCPVMDWDMERGGIMSSRYSR